VEQHLTHIHTHGLSSAQAVYKWYTHVTYLGFFVEKWYTHVMKKPKATIVSETNLGIYVWQLPDGDFVAQGLDVLSIEAVRGDIQAMAAIQKAAKYYGYPEGSPVFVEGKRKITDDEFQVQLSRMRQGMTPDPQDIGNYKDEMRKMRNV
jgi:hypothetical protein